MLNLPPSLKYCICVEPEISDVVNNYKIIVNI